MEDRNIGLLLFLLEIIISVMLLFATRDSLKKYRELLKTRSKSGLEDTVQLEKEILSKRKLTKTLSIFILVPFALAVSIVVPINTDELIKIVPLTLILSAIYGLMKLVFNISIKEIPQRTVNPKIIASLACAGFMGFIIIFSIYSILRERTLQDELINSLVKLIEG